MGIDEPGWHFQIPFVDTVIGLNIVERPDVIDKLAAMTADALSDSVEYAQKAGMNDYVTKPVKQEALEKVLLRFSGYSTES